MRKGNIELGAIWFLVVLFSIAMMVFFPESETASKMSVETLNMWIVSFLALAIISAAISFKKFIE